IKIRVKTYAHTLKRFEEELADQASKRNELQRRVEEKRRELLEGRRRQLQQAALRDPDQVALEAAYQAYAEEESTPAGFTEEDLVRRDIAPLPPVESEIVLRKGG
ncbi:MAG TPA: hypothetical protein VE981_04955, partial [Planctomycetota bacterium]|nr:hypothetical protein [Planctomycetota bacterium]